MAAVEITESPFGKLAESGEEVTLITMKDANSGIVLGLITFGARVVKLEVPDVRGKMVDVVLGHDHLTYYEQDDGPYFGATVGRVANRISNGKFSLDGKLYSLPTNNGENHLHGGPKGFNRKNWSYEIDRSRAAVIFRTESSDGEQGYPGNLSVTVTYTFDTPRVVKVSFHATTDAATPVSMTNHAYFNLAGHAAGKKELLLHQVQLACSQHTPTDEGLIPTGELRTVSGNMDLRSRCELKEKLPDCGFDDNFCTVEPAGSLRAYGTVTHPGTGIAFKMLGTLPGVQFYTGNFLPNSFPGKGGVTYERQGAFCLEPQFHPDSVNNKLSDCILKPGEEYNHLILWDFAPEF